MSYFKNAVCPVCRELLNEQDDVVVCPECGAPYHRACYKEAGRCLYEDKHGTGFSYLPDPEPEQKEETPRQVLCPRCHKSNPADAHACGNCGTPLAPSESEPFDPTPAYRRSRTDVHPDTEKFRPIGGGYIHFGFSTDDAQDELEPDDALRAQLEAANIDSNETIDGFTLKEWLSYLGPSAPIYLFQFKQMDRSRHGRAFSLSAALFAPVYFLYRKMWGWGVISLLCKILCMLPSLLILLEVYQLLPTLPFTDAQLQQYSLYLTYLDLALSLFWGMAAYTLYRRRCVRSIGQIKAAFAAQADNPDSAENTDSLYMRLAKAGGVSLVGVTVLGALGMLLYLPSLFMLWL